MLRASLAAVAFAASVSAPLPAFADPPSGPVAERAPVPPAAAPRIDTTPVYRPNVRAAMAVGLFTMLIPGVVGGTRTALGATDGEKTAGLLVASGGFALAPIFSHMITHEWERAAQFGALPVISSVAATGYAARYPSAVFHGDMGTRTAFGILLGLGLLGAVVGIADTAMAGERARDREKSRHSRFFVSPSFDGQAAALTIGGAL